MARRECQEKQGTRLARARWLAVALVAGLCGLTQAAGAESAGAEPHGLKLGITDDSFLGSDAALRNTWMSRARKARANLILLNVGWSGIAPAIPPVGFEAANPGDPAYDWETLDEAVRSAVEHGMQPVLAINRAPRWAEGPDRPSFARAAPGTWMPQPRELARFARALAARYSGRYPDPSGVGAEPLPRVRFFEIWAEENLSVHLNPQWRQGRPFAPDHYRAMLNAAYAAIHGVDAGARVILGGLSPYGDAKPGGERMKPVWFLRSLLCLRGSRLRAIRCPDPAHFDIWAHNPINVGGPSLHAVSPLDASTPDIHRLAKVVSRALSSRRALPAKPKPFWAGEIWWDTKPPDPGGVPMRRHTRFLVKSLFSLWRQGASAVIWWYLRDQSHATGFSVTQQSGLFFRDGRPKLTYRAYRFPFIALRRGRDRLLVWGKAPARGRLVVERRARRGWTELAHTAAGRDRIFTAHLASRGRPELRARQGGQSSLPWRPR